MQHLPPRSREQAAQNRLLQPRATDNNLHNAKPPIERDSPIHGALLRSDRCCQETTPENDTVSRNSPAPATKGPVLADASEGARKVGEEKRKPEEEKEDRPRVLSRNCARGDGRSFNLKTKPSVSDAARPFFSSMLFRHTGLGSQTCVALPTGGNS